MEEKNISIKNRLTKKQLVELLNSTFDDDEVIALGRDEIDRDGWIDFREAHPYFVICIRAVE